MKLVPIKKVILDLTHLAVFLEQDTHQRIDINIDKPLKTILEELDKCAGDTIGEIAMAEMDM